MAAAERSVIERLKHLLFGPPQDVEDRRIAHRIALIPLLAWVGLGADGLSSSAYGPEAAFRAMEKHTYLAIPLAAVMMLTIFVLCACYSRIIERFPQGGGGYVVASALLGKQVGLVSGSALLIDYILTVTVSIAAAGSALFSFVSPEWHIWKLPVEVGLILTLVMINIRGVRESVLILAPIFMLFGVTHVITLGWGVFGHLPELPATIESCHEGFRVGLAELGLGGMMVLFLHAYSLGGGTYTGIEAVSNGLAIMREPRVHTARRTMLYMGVSLAVVASGLLVCYLLWKVEHQEGKTLNAVLLEKISESWGAMGGAFTVVTLVSEGALLVVAAQAGFIDGPRVLASMAMDSWMPRRFASLSERLTTHNGIVLIGLTSLAALLYTRGNVEQLVVMYSINVFVTFSLSMIGMTKWSVQARTREPKWRRLTMLFGFGTLMCLSILGITTFQKFAQGGWLTLLATATVVSVCLLIRSHYDRVSVKLQQLQTQLSIGLPRIEPKPLELDPTKPTAVMLVGGYSGLGMHTMFTVYRAFPGHFKNFAFLSVGVVDSGEFKGEFAVEDLRKRTVDTLEKYVALANQFNVPATYRYAIGTDVVDEAEALCLSVAEEFSNVTIFAGQILFQREGWLERLLHNQTAFAIQRRVQWAGRIMVILPIRLW
jgi:amino acid transporter